MREGYVGIYMKGHVCVHIGTCKHTFFLINTQPLQSGNWSLIGFKEQGDNNRTVNTNDVCVDTPPLVFPGRLFCLLCLSAQDYRRWFSRLGHWILKGSQANFNHTYNQTVNLWGVTAPVLAKVKRQEILEGTDKVIVQGKRYRWKGLIILLEDKSEDIWKSEKICLWISARYTAQTNMKHVPRNYWSGDSQECWPPDGRQSVKCMGNMFKQQCTVWFSFFIIE